MDSLHIIRAIRITVRRSFAIIGWYQDEFCIVRDVQKIIIFYDMFFIIYCLPINNLFEKVYNSSKKKVDGLRDPNLVHMLDRFLELHDLHQLFVLPFSRYN